MTRRGWNWTAHLGRSRWVAVLSLCTAMLGCQRPPARTPNVLLIVLDTLRADRLGSYGNHRGLTPFMDGLAKKGTVFANAYAASSWTCPSVASLLTSRYPSQHHVTRFVSKLPDAEITLAEKLEPLHFATGGFSANLRLVERYGYAQGFQHWQAYMADPKPRGDLLRSESLAWLDSLKGQPSLGPTLLYLQYVEPHGAYVPPEPFRSRFQRPATDGVTAEGANGKLLTLRFDELTKGEVDLLESLYDGEVASLDAELKTLFQELERRGFLEHSIVVITADHGEEFRDHGGMIHGLTLYNETIHVPLIVLVPGEPGGRVVAENVSLIDVAPTLLELLGLPPEPRFEGRSLVPLLQGRKVADRDVITQLEDDMLADVRTELHMSEPAAKDSRHHIQAIIRQSMKLLVDPDGKTEVYNLAQDGRELHANGPDSAVAASRLRGALTQARAALDGRAGRSTETRPLSEQDKERLKALGYTS